MLGSRDKGVGLGSQGSLWRLGRGGGENVGMLKQQPEKHEGNGGTDEVHDMSLVDRVKRCTRKREDRLCRK